MKNNPIAFQNGMSAGVHGSVRASAHLSPWHLYDYHFAGCNGLLQPELLDVQVANLANPLSQDAPTCGGRVRLEFKTWVIPEVIREAFGVEHLDGSFEGSVELRLAR